MAALLCGCFSAAATVKESDRNNVAGNENIIPSCETVRITAGNRSGELLVQASHSPENTYYILVADAAEKIVARRILYSTKLCRISGLHRGTYRFSVYSNSKEISAGEIKAS